MGKSYNFKEIEKKWQEHWYENNVFHVEEDLNKKKFYGLIEFPYPSGVGMHVGHIRAYSGIEAVARKRRLEGYNVLFPIGYDAFGLPTENFAMKVKKHPRIITDQNIHSYLYFSFVFLCDYKHIISFNIIIITSILIVNKNIYFIKGKINIISQNSNEQIVSFVYF